MRVCIVDSQVSVELRLEHLHFESSQGESSQIRLTVLLDAVSVLKEMNQSGKRRLPPEAPIAFVPARFRPFVESKENKGEIESVSHL